MPLPFRDGRARRRRSMTFTVRRFCLYCAITLLNLSAARAETIDVSDDHGGSVAEYDARWTELAQRGVAVRIVGPCQSACTVLLGHIPRNRICVTPEASFGFHLARRQDATATLWNAYPDDIREWINRHGGLNVGFIWMGAPDIYRHFKKC